jgi:hypothetical protein
MPMNASDGPHYGANIKLPGADGPGTYTVRFLIQNPEAQGYVLHVDQETGVPGRFWSVPLVAVWTIDYAGPVWEKGFFSWPFKAGKYRRRGRVSMNRPYPRLNWTPKSRKAPRTGMC